jgi:hypothetical protein
MAGRLLQDWARGIAMSLAYRGLEHVAASRYAELAETREEQIAVLRAARAAYSRRVARIAGGAVGTLGALFVFGVAIVAALDGRGFMHDPETRGFLTRALLLSWPCAFAVYVGARVLARAKLDALLAKPLARTGDWAHDLSRLELDAPARLVESRAAPLEGWSAALPLVALSFLMPLTLHYLFVLVTSGGTTEARSFDEWISVSVAIVGHAHLVLAICAWRFGRKLARRESSELANGVTGDWLKAYGLTLLAGAIPGALFFLIPPILVGITGLAFIPFMFVIMKNRVLGERLAIESNL